MEFSSQPAQMLTGACPGCGHSFTLLEGVLAPGRRAGGATDEGVEPGDGPEPVSAIAGPPCSVCGAPLTVTASSGGLDAVCSGCSSTFQFVLRSDDEPAPRRAPARPSFRNEESGGYGAPRARPCRECGGPLQFTTSPDGLVTGTCASCGNRFTLPPRRSEGGPGRGGRPGGRAGFSQRPRGRPNWGRGGDRGGPPRYGSRPPSFRRREGRRSSDDDEGSENRRRRRDDGD